MFTTRTAPGSNAAVTAFPSEVDALRSKIAARGMADGGAQRLKDRLSLAWGIIKPRTA